MTEKNRKSLTLFATLVGVAAALATLWTLFRGGARPAAARQARPATIREMYDLARTIFPTPSMAQIVTAQAMLETGRFQSRIYKELNNAFGFGGEGNYKAYANVIDSLRDLKKWLESKGLSLRFSSPGDYARMIRQFGFYTASLDSYTAAMKSLYEEVRNAT